MYSISRTVRTLFRSQILCLSVMGSLLVILPSTTRAQGRWTHPDTRFADVETALTNDDFPKAQKLLVDLRAQAKKSKDVAFQAEILERGKEITKLSRESERFGKAIKALEKDSNDAKASLDGGKYLCFVKGDWNKGLPLLCAGIDTRLAAVAEADKLSPKEPADQLRVADLWWQYGQKITDADERAACLLRSRFWMMSARMATDEEGIATIKARLKQIPIVPDRIVVWNTHNAGYNDRGAIEIVVSLLNDGKVVWTQPFRMPWKANEPSFILIRPVRTRADQVRVDITKHHMTSGGLGEIQVFAGNTNVAQGMLAEVETVFEFKDEHGPGALVDGDLSGKTGFWISQNGTGGWAMVDFQQLAVTKK